MKNRTVQQTNWFDTFEVIVNFFIVGICFLLLFGLAALTASYNIF